MQKTYLYAVFAILIALVCAYGVKTAYISALGIDPETEMLEDIGDMMVEAQDVFGNNVSTFLNLSESLSEYDSLVLIRGGDSNPYIFSGDSFSSADTLELATQLQWLLDGTDAENSDTEEIVTLYVYIVVVTEDYIKLYTGFHNDAYVGLIYDRSGYGLEGLDTISLYEDWYVFSVIDH